MIPNSNSLLFPDGPGCSTSVLPAPSSFGTFITEAGGSEELHSKAKFGMKICVSTRGKLHRSRSASLRSKYSTGPEEHSHYADNFSSINEPTWVNSLYMEILQVLSISQKRNGSELFIVTDRGWGDRGKYFQFIGKGIEGNNQAVGIP